MMPDRILGQQERIKVSGNFKYVRNMRRLLFWSLLSFLKKKNEID